MAFGLGPLLKADAATNARIEGKFEVAIYTFLCENDTIGGSDQAGNLTDLAGTSEGDPLPVRGRQGLGGCSQVSGLG